MSSLALGGQTYTKAELLALLQAASKSDASLILADQLIGLKWNIANGGDGTPVSATISDADAVLSLYPGKLPYEVKTNSTDGRRMTNDGKTLENFNNGLLTPGRG